MHMRGAGSAGVNITEGIIWRQLLAFFFPILFGTFFQQLYNTADAMIVGRFVGKEALGAVGGATGVLINVIVNLFVGLSAGTTVVVAQIYGAGRHGEVEGAVHTSMALALAGGLGMTVFGLLFAPLALQWMGTPAEVMPYALTYIRIVLLGVVPSFLYNMGSGVLRAVGDTRRPVYFLIIACLTNIVLDFALVAGMGLGVFGAACATIASQTLSGADPSFPQPHSGLLPFSPRPSPLCTPPPEQNSDGRTSRRAPVKHVCLFQYYYPDLHQFLRD